MSIGANQTFTSLFTDMGWLSTVASSFLEILALILTAIIASFTVRYFRLLLSGSLETTSKGLRLKQIQLQDDLEEAEKGSVHTAASEQVTDTILDKVFYAVYSLKDSSRVEYEPPAAFVLFCHILALCFNVYITWTVWASIWKRPACFCECSEPVTLRSMVLMACGSFQFTLVMSAVFSIYCRLDSRLLGGVYTK